MTNRRVLSPAPKRMETRRGLYTTIQDHAQADRQTQAGRVSRRQLSINAAFAPVYPGSGRTKAKKIRPALCHVLEFLLALIVREQT